MFFQKVDWIIVLCLVNLVRFLLTLVFLVSGRFEIQTTVVLRWNQRNRSREKED